MIIKRFKEPVEHIIIQDVFPENINKQFINESIKIKDKFEDSTVSNNNIIDKKIRTNKVAYLDSIYENNRLESNILTNISSLLADKKINAYLKTMSYPLSIFRLTNTHETQLSRYGNQEEKYDWHTDETNDSSRTITLVYYFNKEPKKYKGGDLILTDSPIFLTELDKKASRKKITPKNNMAVLFPSTTGHRVTKTTSPEDFELGRFSINCWIGFR